VAIIRVIILKTIETPVLALIKMSCICCLSVGSHSPNWGCLVLPQWERIYLDLHGVYIPGWADTQGLHTLIGEEEGNMGGICGGGGRKE
jgi:ABC-type antimicrobial peptide transport system permease subunit